MRIRALVLTVTVLLAAVVAALFTLAPAQAAGILAGFTWSN